jgi:hypothetical protein
LPQFFLADGQIKIRLTDKLGNAVLTQDNILVIGPSPVAAAVVRLTRQRSRRRVIVKSAYGTQTHNRMGSAQRAYDRLCNVRRN